MTTTLPHCQVLEQLYTLCSDALIFTDENGVIQFVNPAALALFGYTREELIGHFIEMLIPQEYRQRHLLSRQQYMQCPKSRPMGSGLKLSARHKSGENLAVDISLCPLTDNDMTMIAVFIRDVRMNRLVEDKLYFLAHHDPLTGLMNSDAFYGALERIVIQKPDGSFAIFLIDIDDFKRVNDSFGHAIGNQLLIALSQRLTHLLCTHDMISRIGGDEFACVVREIHHVQSIAQMVTRQLSLPYFLNHLKVVISVSIGISLFPSDSTNSKQLLAQADQAMYYVKKRGKNNFSFYSRQLLEQEVFVAPEDCDYLTGIYNFKKFRKELYQRLLNSPQDKCAVVLCGVSHFKIINAIYGSDVADQVLVKIAHRIRDTLPQDAIFARKAGDELIWTIFSADKAIIMKLTAKIQDVLKQSFLVNEQQIEVATCIGISRYLVDARHLETLLVHADVAMQKAKTLGRNQIQFCSVSNTRHIHYLQILQHDVPHVLARRELFLLYQPQIEISTGEVVGVEVVLRWHHPKLGSVKPTIFIPLMERMGMMAVVSDWMLIEVCRQVKQWQVVQPTLKVAVNISAQQLMSTSSMKSQHALLNSVVRAIKQSNVSPQYVELEITESAMLDSDKKTMRNIRKLKALGIRIACDDFGSGYASFTRLNQLVFDTIKIDKSLISGIGMATNCIIIESIITIARELKADVVAEGVTTKEQVDFLRKLGCTCAQGYYFSKPLSVMRLSALLKIKRQSVP